MSPEDGDFPTPTLCRINACISLTSFTLCCSASVAGRRDRTRVLSSMEAFMTWLGEPRGGLSRHSMRASSWSFLMWLSHCRPNSSCIFFGVSWPVITRRRRGKLWRLRQLFISTLCARKDLPYSAAGWMRVKIEGTHQCMSVRVRRCNRFVVRVNIDVRNDGEREAVRLVVCPVLLLTFL